MSKKVTANYSRKKQSVTRALYQYDYGQVLVLGDGFPDINEFHFSNKGSTKTIVQFGTNRGVRIPNEVLNSGKDIEVMLFSHVARCDGESVYKIIIPVMARNPVDENKGEGDPVEYVFDGGDSEIQETSPCQTTEYIFDGGDSTSKDMPASDGNEQIPAGNLMSLFQNMEFVFDGGDSETNI